MPYPPWVMEHKKKGMYVNKINESTYRIYRGHSERVKGTGMVRRVVDEYIGTITETDGLILTKSKIKGEVRTLRSGGYALVRWFCCTQIEGVLRRMGEEGHSVAAVAVLHVLYGEATDFLYKNDWVGIAHPGVSLPLPPSAGSEAKRVARAMSTTLASAVGEQLSAVLEASSFVYKVWVNGQWVNAAVPEQCKVLAHTCNFRWEV